MRWHRRLAWWVVLPLLAWSLSGLMHPLMARWQPRAAEMQVPTSLLATSPTVDTLPAPASVLPAGSWQRLRLITVSETPYWLAVSADSSANRLPVLASAQTGAVDAALLPALMTSLARHYTGDATSAVRLSVVTSFSAAYPSVNRYLPVVRVQFDRPDGLSVFIEPNSLKLAALTNTWKTRFTAFFQAAHTWSWWPHAPSRTWVMAAVLSLGVGVVLTGVWRWLAQRASAHRRTGMPRWHRVLGLTVGLALLAWLTTGAFHSLLMQDRRSEAAQRTAMTWPFTSEALTVSPVRSDPMASLMLIGTPQGPVWLSQAPRSPALYRDLNGTALDPERYWLALAAPVAGDRALKGVETIAMFNHEYGFVQKRLPVQRLGFEGPGDLAVFVDPADGVVASVVQTLDRVEGFGFAYLHKAQWLDGLIGKTARDAVASLFALGVFALVLMGSVMGVRRSFR